MRPTHLSDRIKSRTAFVTVGAPYVRRIVPVYLDVEDYQTLIAPTGLKVSIGSHGYAQIWDRETKRVMLLHRVVLGLREKTGYRFIADHINGNVRDNRKENLRIVSPRDSNANRGVSRNRALPMNVVATETKSGTRYRVQLRIGGRAAKKLHVGTFMTVADAVAARDSWLEANHV